MMSTPRGLGSAARIATIAPAIFFLSAVAASAAIAPKAYLAIVAHGVVTWYSHRLWTLWIFLVAMPLASLISGGVTILNGWRRQPLVAMSLTVCTTTVATGILIIVGLHILAN